MKIIEKKNQKFILSEIELNLILRKNNMISFDSKIISFFKISFDFIFTLI